MQVSIIDDGPGLPIEAAQAFENRDASQVLISTKEDGNGIGLQIAKSIARSQGGELFYQRDGGKTIFSLVLPLGVPI